eukprot:TRINITY_DN74005_c0_g1_i1.p1 TRINITY_DN74005_c0_g1~~TRINITY_DN74005_c0_g1_i1.p1  ORF type:complete len:526 (+),score=127.35 TRINITY_DN74005_c0_g1_i1:65-1579(+)
MAPRSLAVATGVPMQQRKADQGGDAGLAAAQTVVVKSAGEVSRGRSAQSPSTRQSGRRSPQPRQRKEASPAFAAREDANAEAGMPPEPIEVSSATATSAPQEFAASRSRNARATAGGGGKATRGAEARGGYKSLADREAEAAARAEALREECARLAAQRAEVEAELQRWQVAAPESASRRHDVDISCASLEVQVAQAEKAVAAARAHLAEATARTETAAAQLGVDRDALEDELDRLRANCEELQVSEQDLRRRHDEASGRRQRGLEERQQLRAELFDRQAERSALAAEKVAVERAESQQRVEAKSLEAHICRLAKLLEHEDKEFEHLTLTMRGEEALGRAAAADARRACETVERQAPKELEAERDEAQRCADVAAGMQREVLHLRERAAAVRSRSGKSVAERDNLQRGLWRAEGSRDSARAARRQTESELANVEGELTRLEELVAWVEEQNLQLARSKLPLQHACANLVQRGVRDAVASYLLEYPRSQPPSPRADLPHPAASAV